MFRARKRKLAIGCMLLGVFFLCSCTKYQEGKKPMQMDGFFFDTVIKIQVWGKNDENLMAECEELCKKYEQLFDRKNENSDVWKINHSNGNSVEVSEETAFLIKEALEYSRVSKGAFDISVAPLSDLWDVKNNPGNIPSNDEIEKAKVHVGYDKVKLQGNTVTLEDPKMAIDLGAVAKGYIADQLKEFLCEKGVKQAIIDLGGNVLAIGHKQSGEPYHIGIQRPFANRGEIITTVTIQDKSVVSSGTYERYFKVKDKIYHHIMNPKTGYPYENDLLQVTIISDSSLKGDIFSTMCYTLGLEEGKKLVEQQKNMQAIFVTKDETIHRVGF